MCGVWMAESKVHGWWQWVEWMGGSRVRGGEAAAAGLLQATGSPAPSQALARCWPPPPPHCQKPAGPTCVSASVLLISMLKISEAAIMAKGVSGPRLFAMPIAIAVLPVPGCPASSTPRPAILPSLIICVITPAACVKERRGGRQGVEMLRRRWKDTGDRGRTAKAAV